MLIINVLFLVFYSFL